METYDVIFWDLDGTLINPKRRLYDLFRELTGCSLSYDSYWRLKAQGMNQRAMLAHIGYSGDFDTFQRRWLQNVERQDLLEKDTLIDDARQILQQMSKAGYKMYIITNRQSLDCLLYQLDSLRIRNCFVRVLTTLQKCTKSELIQKSGIVFKPKHALFIGDSEEDMNAAKNLGIDSILITENGKEIATTYHVKKIIELRNVLMKNM